MRHVTKLGVCAAALSAFSAIPARADLSTWSVRGPIQLQAWNDTTNDYDVVLNIATTNTPITNGITIVGNQPSAISTGNNVVFTLTGTQYAAINPGVGQPDSVDHGLRLIGIEDAILLQPYDNTVDRIPTNFDIGVNLTGSGTVNVFNAESDYSLADASDNDLENVGSSGFIQSYTAGSSESGFQYVDNFGIPNAGDGTHIVGAFVVGLDWSGFAPSDVLEFSLPTAFGNGITVQEVAIPEPASLSVLSISALTFLSRKRRRA